MTTPEEIQSQKKRLRLYRRTLSHSLEQMAMLGSAHAPPGLVHTISEARDNILHIKSVLRGRGVEVKDHPDDDDLNMSNDNHTQSEPGPNNHNLVETQEEKAHPNNKDSSSQTSNTEESNDFEDSIEWEKLEFGGNLLTVSRPKVKITFNMPYAFEDAKCEVEFSSPRLNRVEISLNHTDILGYFMLGLDTSPDSGARRFVRKTDTGLFEARLGQTYITLQENEALDLCACIDIVCSEYKKRIIEAENLLETGNFLLMREEDIPGTGFYLISIQPELWKLMCKFKSEFDCDKGNSEWHIFDGTDYCIHISQINHSKISDNAFIYGKKGEEYLPNNYINLMYGLPKWLLNEIDDIRGGWKNNVGIYGIWTATYTKNWLLNRLILAVCQHYLGTSESCYDLVCSWKQKFDINTQRPINEPQEKKNIQQIDQPNQLSKYINDIQSWFHYSGLNRDSPTVIHFFQPFLELAKDVEPTTINSDYIWGKFRALSLDILGISGIDKNNAMKSNYSDILVLMSSYISYLNTVKFVSSTDMDKLFRIAGAIIEGRFTRIDQSRLNILKKHLLPLWEESEFERRYVMTQWNWNGLWFKR